MFSSAIHVMPALKYYYYYYYFIFIFFYPR